MVINQWDSEMHTGGTTSVCGALATMFTDRMSPSLFRQTLRRVVDSIISESAEGDAAAPYREICDLRIPFDALSAYDSMMASQVVALFSKRNDIDLGVDRESVAWEKFRESERICRETNDIFKLWRSGRFQFRPDVERIFHTAQRKIASVLGDVPEISQLRMRFGPGSTTTTQKRMASPRYKLGQTLACSEDLAGTVSDVLAEVPSWVGLDDDTDSVVVTVEIHHGVLQFVPKNAKTDRSIVVEPVLNGFVQLGIGDYISQRLRLRGVDLRDQTANQRLARQGSIDGALATLDLSSASDTIAIELVAHLLPIDWFLLLSRARTGTISYKGETIKLQKFSSMGNGFTFPLESLIFWALSSSCIEGDEVVSVYGDDIIVPTHRAPLVVAALAASGFSVNPEKSFTSGPFRESCGADYHSGINIRPFYQKTVLSGSSLFVMHNFFVRRDDFDAVHLIRSFIAPELQIWGPEGYGDGHLLRLMGEAHDLQPHNRGIGWAGYTFETFTWRGLKSFRPSPGDYVYSLYSIYIRSSDVDLNPTSGVELWPKDFRKLRKFSTDSSPYRGDSFGVTLPGHRGYKRIKIYTLTPLDTI